MTGLAVGHGFISKRESMKATAEYLEGMTDGEWINLRTGLIEDLQVDQAPSIFPKVVPFLSVPKIREHREHRRAEVERRILASQKPRALKSPGTKKKGRKRRPKVPLHLKAMFDKLSPEQQESLLDSLASI